MGWTARKSFKVMPGVRMTVSKSGLSTSVGGHGYRVTRTASGRVTRTVSLPGTGIRHTETIRGTGRARAAAPAMGSYSPPKPGLMAPKWEKELYRAVMSEDFAGIATVGELYPEVRPLVAAIDGFIKFMQRDHDRAKQLLAFAWEQAGRIETHPFVQRYMSASSLTLDIAEGITATLPLTRDAVGLALAELQQGAGDLAAAIATVEHVEPTTIAAVSLAELCIAAGRFDDVVEMTNSLTNTDDATALLLTFRGIAFREQGHQVAAREAFKEALKSKSRSAVIRHRALIERASSYAKDGKPGMARKDLERVLAEDAAYPGVQDALANL